MKFVKYFSKISRTPFIHGHCHIAAKFRRSSCYSMFWKVWMSFTYESLPKFKENLFLMTAFEVYHMCREHGECSSKFGGVDRAPVSVWGSMGGGTP